jgi:hypothetical protein
MRRPPSLSESYLSDYKFLGEKLEPLRTTINVVDAGEITNPVNDTTSNSSTKVTYCEYSTEYFLRFSLHITMISFFETLFFFQFVSKDEDQGISSISRFYSDKIISSCTNINKTYIPLINVVLNGVVNVTEIVNAGDAAFILRNNDNLRLNNISWIYFGGLSGGLVLLILFSVVKRYKIKWGHLFIENLIFVTMLGLYEVMFFETIIKKYTTLTPAEISSDFVLSLRANCGVF